MKIDLKVNQLPIFTLLCGGIGILLRLWQYGTGLGEDGLLLVGHPAGILVLVLSAAVAGVLIWFTRDFAGTAKYSCQFPVSTLGAAGAFISAVGLLLTATAELVRQDSPFALLTGVLGIATAAALAFTGLCRLKGLRPNSAFHTVVCLYFVLRLISRYQTWSSDPQLHDYCFQLLATVCAMLFSYHRAALDMKAEKRRHLVILGLLGSYFSCLATVQSEAILLYVGLAAWMITNLGTLDFPDEVPLEES